MDDVDALIRRIEELDAAMWRQWREGSTGQRGEPPRLPTEALARSRRGRVPSSVTEPDRSHSGPPEPACRPAAVHHDQPPSRFSEHYHPQGIGNLEMAPTLTIGQRDVALYFLRRYVTWCVRALGTDPRR